MTTTFRDYELISRSQLFDSPFYLARYPDVSASHIDALLHYVEYGARQLRDPRPDFDAAFYVSQCVLQGESAHDNPLLHFIEFGASKGIHASAKAAQNNETEQARLKLAPGFTVSIDAPRVIDGVAEAAIIGSLAVQGWALGPLPITSVEILVDGEPMTRASCGIRRDDVAAVFQDHREALHSGFATLIPHWLLPKGHHLVAIVLRDSAGTTTGTDFHIQVEDTPEGDGPWSLRRKISQAEINLHENILAGLRWQPNFLLIMAVNANDEAIAAARRTFASLRRQTYGHWRAAVILQDTSQQQRQRLRKILLEGFDDIAANVRVHAANSAVLLSTLSGNHNCEDQVVLVAPLSAGDELGCDALAELAIASGLNPDCDFFYSDERCRSPITKSMDAFFKPDWSPDLLLSSNYIGRLWCAESSLLKTAELTVGDWLDYGDYELVLRTTEVAHAIHHLATVLCQRTGFAGEKTAVERQALTRALQRRGIKGQVRAGCARGIYNIRRVAAKTLVSIIIPTCASRGLIKICIETLRAKTTYPAIEIICIENIPEPEQEWKRWLNDNADHVIATKEPFNWSRYNNLAAEKASGEFLLFLNDDVEIIDPNWLDILVANAARLEVGVVGPQLLYADRSVQHAGLALTQVVGSARHIFRHAREDDPGYFGMALTQRNVIGVTGACLITRREVFDQLGGFTEAHNIVNNDVDYCLRSLQQGFINVFAPQAKLIHHEMVSRGELGDEFDTAAFDHAWRDLFVRGDPYLNPHLSRDADNVMAEQEPVRVTCTANPLFARDTIASILIVKLDHIGDCMTAMPALRRLRRTFPKARLAVLAAKATCAVWAQQPGVDEVIEFDYFHTRSGLGKKSISEPMLKKLRQRLAPEQFDLAVDLRKSPDARHVLQYTGARYLAGFDHQAKYPWLDIALEWEGDHIRAAKRHAVGIDLLSLIDAIALRCEAETAKPRWAGKLAMNAERRRLFKRRVVCIHPCAGTEMRQWPPQHFAQLIELLLTDESLNIAVIGSPDDTAVVESILALVRNPGQRLFNLAGKLTLAELPAFISRCDLFVGNNSGPQHMAAELGVPAIGIHSGVVDPKEWGPAGPNAVAISREMACSPCYLEKLADCTRGFACMKGLPAREVHALSERLLAVRAKMSVRVGSEFFSENILLAS